MRLKNTLILLVIAAVFLIYFFSVEQPRHQEELREIERSTRITDLKRKNIFHVTIARDVDTLAFDREGEGWRITVPVKDNANAAAVNTLVSSALEAKIERSLRSEDIDEAAYGLGSPPDATLILQTTARDTSLTIHLGRHNITKSHFYARLDTSEEVLLLPAGLRRYALQELSDFRDKSLIGFDLDDVRSLTLSSPDHSLSWTKDSRDRWTAVLSGDTVVGGKDQIDAVLRRLRGIRVRRFLSDNPADYPIYFPERANTLSIWTRPDLTKHTVYFGAGRADTCHAWVEGNDRLVSISAAILSAFDKSYDDLRDRNAFHFDREALARIRLNTAVTTATIIKTGTEWAFTNPLFGSIDQNQISNLFRQMEILLYSEVLENRISRSSAGDLLAPSFQLTLYDRQDRIVDELSCSPHESDNSRHLATSRSSGLLGLIENESLQELKQAFDNLRSK